MESVCVRAVSLCAVSVRAVSVRRAFGACESVRRRARRGWGRMGWDGREMAAKAAQRKAPSPLKESLSFNLKKASVLVSNPTGTP
jgi:hypothetical protein